MTINAANVAPLLRLSQLRRSFGEFSALSGLDLNVSAGEVFTLLGPSGCGKTTTLRLVAGLEVPDSGEIWLNDKMIVGGNIFTPPHRRDLGMVFQSYAIWPHMTVFENVAFPLRVRRIPKREILRRVQAVLGRVGLSALEDRPGTALSGGQQQRVAIARAIVYEPKLLLLDEPFSNLDAKLREQMRLELKKLLKELGITVLLVTHDQEEAMGISDRVAVMSGGRIEQIGTAIEIYEKPKCQFVRDFLGRTVLVRGSVVAASDGALTFSPSENIGNGANSVFKVTKASHADVSVGQKIILAIRPEQIGVSFIAGSTEERFENTADACIETLMFIGDRYEARFRLGDLTFIGYLPRGIVWQEGQTVRLQFPSKDLSVWPG